MWPEFNGKAFGQASHSVLGRNVMSRIRSLARVEGCGGSDVDQYPAMPGGDHTYRRFATSDEKLLAG
jgi:hypothetical protein